MKPQTQVNSITDTLGSLAEPLRLRLLVLCEAQELAVGEVAKVVQLPQSTVSRHLKVLTEAGWLTRRPEGTAALFSLVPDNLTPSMRAVWAAVREGAASEPLAAEDAGRLRAVLAERRTDSHAFFGRVSGEWDRVRVDLFGDRFTPLALLGLLRRDWVIADLGCGTGNVAECVAPYVAKVLAVDFSAPMLEAAARRLAGAANVQFVEAPLEKTGLPGACVDVAVCSLALHHVEAPGAVMVEAARLLRADRGGGVLLVIDMVEHARDEFRRMGHKHLGFSPQRMKVLFEEAGLADHGYVHLPVEADAKGPGLFVACGRLRA
ncbi:MAG: methyltransferase domain-containing protein [Leptolyngbya sp. PLA1]|nr:methyltransferase domain-containing protein [Leptolyngbya sp. PLA1]